MCLVETLAGQRETSDRGPPSWHGGPDLDRQGYNYTCISVCANQDLVQTINRTPFITQCLCVCDSIFQSLKSRHYSKALHNIEGPLFNSLCTLCSSHLEFQ